MFSELNWLHLLWLTPLLAVFLAACAWRRRHALARLGGLDGVRPALALLRAVCVLAAVTLIVLALAGPQWGEERQEVRQQGRDVVFLLDVSRSMLATDVKPSRLERAKADIADSLPALAGSRVGLVAFAGEASVLCPLTYDHGFFRMMLADASPASVARGGTAMGDALRKVMKEVFDQQQKDCKDIVLITDGEDHATFPVEAAEQAGAQGIRLIAVGLGDDAGGTPIEIQDEAGQPAILRHQGKVV